MSGKETDEDWSFGGFGRVDKTLNPFSTERCASVEFGVVSAERFDGTGSDPFGEVTKLAWSKSDSLREQPGESAETVVANFEADVGDAKVRVQEQPLRLVQSQRRDELVGRQAGDLMKDAVEVERAEIGDARHV